MHVCQDEIQAALALVPMARELFDYLRALVALAARRARHWRRTK